MAAAAAAPPFQRLVRSTTPTEGGAAAAGGGGPTQLGGHGGGRPGTAPPNSFGVGDENMRPGSRAKVRPFRQQTPDLLHTLRTARGAILRLATSR